MSGSSSAFGSEGGGLEDTSGDSDVASAAAGLNGVLELEKYLREDEGADIEGRVCRARILDDGGESCVFNCSCRDCRIKDLRIMLWNCDGFL